jgi:hypothetical protein
MAWSASHKCVTNSYKFALGTGQIKGINYGNLKVNITDSNFFKTNYYRLKGLNNANAVDKEKLVDYNLLRLGDLQEPYMWNVKDSAGKLIGTKGLSSQIISTDLTLQNIAVNSFNNDTGESSDQSYEKMINYPVSSRIFSNNHDGSWITNDLDWSVTATANSSTMQYFKNEYNFKDEYNKTEYQSFGVNENKLEENVCRLSATSFIMDNNTPANKDSMDYGAAGILLTYVDENKGFTGKNELPVAFFEFGKTLHSNYNFLQIDWHEDGVIKVV